LVALFFAFFSTYAWAQTQLSTVFGVVTDSANPSG
jgi:hypothetical protein